MAGHPTALEHSTWIPNPKSRCGCLLTRSRIWTDLALKTGQAMWASAHAAALRSTIARGVAVIPTGDAPAPNAQEAAEALRNPKVAVLPPADARRKPRAAITQPSRVIRFKA